MLKKFLQTFKIALTCVALGNLNAMQPLHAIQCDDFYFVSKSFTVTPHINNASNVTTCEVDLQPSSTFSHPAFVAFAGAIMGACLNTYGPKAWKKVKEKWDQCRGNSKWDPEKDIKHYVPFSLRNKSTFERYVKTVHGVLTENGFQRNVISCTDSGYLGCCITAKEVFLGYRYNGPYSIEHGKIYVDITFNPTGENKDPFHQVHEHHASIKEDHPTIKTMFKDVEYSLDQKNKAPRYTQVGVEKDVIEESKKSRLYRFLEKKAEKSADASSSSSAAAAASNSSNTNVAFPWFLDFLSDQEEEIDGNFYLDNVKHVLHVTFSKKDPDKKLYPSAMLTFN